MQRTTIEFDEQRGCWEQRMDKIWKKRREKYQSLKSRSDGKGINDTNRLWWGSNQISKSVDNHCDEASCDLSYPSIWTKKTDRQTKNVKVQQRKWRVQQMWRIYILEQHAWEQIYFKWTIKNISIKSVEWMKTHFSIIAKWCECMSFVNSISYWNIHPHIYDLDWTKRGLNRCKTQQSNHVMHDIDRSRQWYEY